VLLELENMPDLEFEMLGLKFDFEDLDMSNDDDDDSDGDSMEIKKYLLEVQLPNGMEQADLYDELTNKGHMVKKK
jgi:hypothetical protein